MSNKCYFFEDIGSVFSFGKHKGFPLCFIIAKDPSYIYWCVNNINEFRLSQETIRQIRQLFPNFIIPIEFEKHIGMPKLAEDDYLDNNEDWRIEEEQPTFERYNGSYAQDEMGYSDDDIDTIFDGDPLAYWNID